MSPRLHRCGFAALTRLLGSAALLTAALLLGGCAAPPKYTVDDGRKVDEALLAGIRAYGDGERAIRPAIARSAALKDKDCDRQWELPFSATSSRAWTPDERVAWVRALGVDERLTVVAAAAGSPLAAGERIEGIDGVDRPEEPDWLLQQMAQRRDRGWAFTVRTGSGSQVQVTPFEVCRGYTRFAPPNTPRLQDYHWLMSVHPLELAQASLTDDEALWVVLWTQGLSEMGGLRMKAYDYGTTLLSTVWTLASMASGVKAAAVAADAAVKAAQSAVTAAVTELVKQQLVDQAKGFATRRLRDELSEVAERMTRAQVLNTMQRAAANRGTLLGVARVAATVFDRADNWAFERMARLQANPLAGFVLHQKLIEGGMAQNALLFDPDRLASINQAARNRGLGDQVVSILNGLRPETLELALASMPLASAPTEFSWEDPADISTDPFARGYIDAMLRMPVQTPGGR